LLSIFYQSFDHARVIKNTDVHAGLEYLHKGCNPSLIHRDVKAANILLNAKLEAKIADFGLTKAFNRDNDTHVSTNTLVGTLGYVDPEYANHALCSLSNPLLVFLS
jgi:serine/threonine protein kinase